MPEARAVRIGVHASDRHGSPNGDALAPVLEVAAGASPGVVRVCGLVRQLALGSGIAVPSTRCTACVRGPACRTLSPR